MNRIFIYFIILVLGISQANAQKKAGYFGKRFYIGWEHSIRPFGSMSARLDNLNVGLGKIKVEKLINRNRMLGVSFEKKDYLVHDELKSPGVVIHSQRYLASRNYAVTLKRFYQRGGMAPMGHFTVLSLVINRNSIYEVKNVKTKASFGDVYIGYEFGKSFPLVGKHIIANASVGFYFSTTLLNIDFAVQNYNNYTTFLSGAELNMGLYGMNVIKANVGVSYALF